MDGLAVFWLGTGVSSYSVWAVIAEIFDTSGFRTEIF